MRIDEGLIGEIGKAYLRATQWQVILFGSAASGQMTPDSDVDVLVIEDELTGVRQESVRLRLSLGDMGLPMDVFAMTKERFE